MLQVFTILYDTVLLSVEPTSTEEHTMQPTIASRALYVVEALTA